MDKVDSKYELIERVKKYVDIHAAHITHPNLVHLINTTPYSLYYQIDDKNHVLDIQNNEYTIEELYYINANFPQVSLNSIIEHQEITPMFYRLFIWEYDDDDFDDISSTYILKHQPQLKLDDLLEARKIGYVDNDSL
ncbi:hypothetical protein OAA60_05440 [Porticoccaceae bacterium]|jgi:hypothetical protein|nr:hypothetical protein [Porticoccaceae bacterium]